MKAILWIEKMIDEVDGTEVSYAGGKADSAFVDFVAGPMRKIAPWLADNGFMLVPYTFSSTEFRMVSADHQTAVIGYNAMGKMVPTGFPIGFLQQMRSIIQVGFIDLASRSFRASIGARLALGLQARKSSKKRKRNPYRRPPPRPGTFSAWMRQVNGILLRELNLGSWQLTKQDYEAWFVTGMRPSSAANIVIGGFASGHVARKYKRTRK